MSLTAIIAIAIATLLAVALVWQWWRGRRLEDELAASLEAHAAALQGEANANTAAARRDAWDRQREAFARLNQEAVHVDPDSPNLVDVFDGATGGDDGDDD